MEQVEWAVLDALPDPAIGVGRDGLIAGLNRAAADLLGRTVVELRGQTAGPLLGDLGLAATAAAVVDAADHLWRGREVLRGRAGPAPVDVSVGAVRLSGPAGVGWVIVLRDATDVERPPREGIGSDAPLGAARAAAERQFQYAFRRSDFGMVIADLDGTATAVNPAICRLIGRNPDELIGRTWEIYAHPEDRAQTAEMLSAVRSGRDSYSGERRYLRPDGTIVWMRTTVNLVRDDADRPIYLMGQLQDVTDRKRLDEEVEHLAYHDGLTGLPNRTLLEDRLDHALAVSTRSRSQVGVMFLDLDGFKHVNDARGHAAGDRLLVEVGDRLKAHVRPSDTVARFGGDEFVVVLDDTNLVAVTAVADRVIRAMREPFNLDGDPVAMHASVGIALSRRGSRPASLLSEADAAMYRAKELGRDQAVVFEDSLRRRAEDMLQGERALRRAIEEHEFVAHYQPVVDLTDGSTVGVEALARWRQADGSLVPPYRFIPLAETSGLIIDLGRSILEQATSEVARWNSRLGTRDPLWVSVNLSARQLEDESVADMIDRVLAETGFPPELLHLEITETVVMHNVSHSITVLERLKTSGVQISIDDFGTGYSSLAYLQNLPVDTLKIDRSFVTHDPPSEHDLSIVKAIIGLTDALGMTSVAEGIETDAQRSLLIDLGCRYGQGYLWCPPLAPRDAYLWAQSPAVTP